MLSEERVKHMTRMAIYEKNEMRKITPALKYAKRDYLELGVLVHFFLGTIIYGVLVAAIVGALYFTVLTNLHLFGLIVGLVLGLLGYVVFLYFYLRFVRRGYLKRYETGAESLKELRKGYRILEQMYDQEEKRKSPEGWS